MGLTDWFKTQAESVGIGYLIGSIENGRYGTQVQSLWFSLKGKKTIIGWSLFAIGGGIALYPDVHTVAIGSTVAVIGSYLGRFGLISKGTDKEPHPSFPEEYRGAFQFALSASTGIIEVLSGIGGLLVLSDNPLASHVSLYALVGAQALSTVTGYLSTLIGPTPKQAAQAQVVVAVAAVETAKVKVEEKKADVVEAVKVAADVAAQPKGENQ